MQSCLCLKNPLTPGRLSAKPFIGKGGGPWLVVANFLVSDHLSLRSGHRQVTMLLEASSRASVSLCSDKGQSAKAQLPSPRPRLSQGDPGRPVSLPWSTGPAPSLCPSTSAQALLKCRAQLVAPISRGWSPEPAQPSSLREPGAQHPVSQVFHLNRSELFV